MKLVTLTSFAFAGQSIFSALDIYASETDPLDNPVCLLIKSIAAMYLECRMVHVGKLRASKIAMKNTNVSSRQMSTKLILFQGL